MSRPKPKIILESSPGSGYKTDQVLYSSGIWAVYHKGFPINLKTVNSLLSYPGPKYKKTSFGNPGHAINLCKKLNAQFQCSDFTVVLLRIGEQVFPDDPNKSK